MQDAPGTVRTATFLLACGLSAQTFVVDAANGPGTNFTSLAVATATVPDGAVLEVRPGNYAPFAILGKSLTLRGSSGVYVFGPIAALISNIASGQTVEIREIYCWGDVQLANCDGYVLFEDAWSTDMSVEALNCRHLWFRNCQMGGAGSHGNTVRLDSCEAAFHGCQIVGNYADAMVLHSSRVQLVDTSVSYLPYMAWSACAMTFSNLRCMRSSLYTLGTAILGSGEVRFDPWTHLTGGLGGPFNGVTATQLEMPTVKVTGGALGTNLTVEMTGPNGDPGALFVALPGDNPNPGFGAHDPLWLQTGTATMCFLTIFASGVPQQSVHTIPNVAAFRGVRLAWQGATVDAAGAVQLSNPAITSHW